jgi:hypothetical protein
MKITAQPDLFKIRAGEDVKFLGSNWIEETIPSWVEVIRKKPEYISIDLSAISFVTLFDWVYLVALVQAVSQSYQPKQIDFDLLGATDFRLIDPAALLSARKDDFSHFAYPLEEQRFSLDRYRLAGFLESLDTYAVLNRPGMATKVIYPGLTQQIASFRSFYSARANELPKVVLGLQRISTKDDCKLFLEDGQILNWRRAMDSRFRASPLFESDEVWRVFCHELAVNIWEHSGVDGFIAARVVESAIDSRSKLRNWCRWTYPSRFHSLLRNIGGSFLELCVADAGQGFVNTLRSTVERAIVHRRVSTEDILMFAFDELGTCKDEDESWATARHGLCRILGLVAKYGGALRLRSADVELFYVAETQRFSRNRGSLGYEPQGVRRIRDGVQGAQLQILLPLTPQFEREDAGHGRSVLQIGLPSSFRTQSNHVQGHLVPLLEKLETPNACIGEELKEFRVRCEVLCRQLLVGRHRLEALVLDFSGINWPAAQLETFLYYLQNVIQYRPVLLVEIDDSLADSAIELEWSQASTLVDFGEFNEENREKRFQELSERRFLETYNSVHSTVLGITRDHKRRRIFGVPSKEYENALLSLVSAGNTIEGLCKAYPSVRENVIRAILTPANLLVEQRSLRNWTLVWTSEAIDIESNRAVIAHFDAVATRSNAWRGRIQCGDKGREKFFLPWMNLWRKEFLQTGRILNRGRHSDEIAQRLIYRLKCGLKQKNLQLEDVRVLVCISAPAMLLASALHRWWPEEPRPAVADLGYYVFSGDRGAIPTIASEGGIVLVQDIVDDGKMSESIIWQLIEQGKSVLFILAMARFVDDVTVPPTVGERICDTEIAALVNVQRPPACEPPLPEIDDDLAFWVEPRSLRPVRLKTLRREFVSGRDLDLERRNQYLEKFENQDDGCLISAGHFVYGLRHFAVTVDVRRALTGSIGDDLAHWIADVCEGSKNEKVPWERDEGFSLEGDVTAVLMPPHSQIHYLWPKVENILAQRGRRQPMWLLEPAFFTGSGPTYGIPLQFKYQIMHVVDEAIKKKKTPLPLRLFVLDDAVATGRTAVTFLSTIIREVRKAIRRVPKGEGVEDVNPIEWIRYFSLVNETDHANYLMWRSISQLSKPAIQFVMEEYAPFMGVLVYNESNCPICRDTSRLLGLIRACDDYGAAGARSWVRRRIEQLRPIAIDGRGFEATRRIKLVKRFDVLGHSRDKRDGSRYLALYMDTAIWRFYELMYLSYPPSELLLSLEKAWATDTEELQGEYERYRWAVMEWCIRNWKRVLTDSGAEVFRTCAMKEIEELTSLTEPLLEAMGTRYEDPSIKEIIRHTVHFLASLESERLEAGRETDRLRIEQAIQLDTALQLFFFNIQRFNQEKLSGRRDTPDRSYDEYLEMLNAAAVPLDRNGHSFLRILYRRLIRPSRFANPRWALEVLAESLYRGRGSSEHAGSHQLLPKLLYNVMKGSPNPEQLRLLHASLVLFLAGLEDLLPYSEVNFSLHVATIKELSQRVIAWLDEEADNRKGVAAEVRYLFGQLELNSKFCRGFEELFHEEPGKFLDKIKLYASQVEFRRLELVYEIDPAVATIPILTHLQRLHLVISNRVVDPIRKFPRKRCRSLIRVATDKSGRGMCLMLLTNFASADETRRLLAESRNAQAEEGLLEEFGVIFEESHAPSGEDIRQGFYAQSEVIVPTGFAPREGR